MHSVHGLKCERYLSFRITCNRNLPLQGENILPVKINCFPNDYHSVFRAVCFVKMSLKYCSYFVVKAVSNIR